jgi:hypothetical protein
MVGEYLPEEVMCHQWLAIRGHGVVTAVTRLNLATPMCWLD